MRNTYAEGTLIRLTQVMDKYKISIMVIQETNQKGNSISELREYIFFSSGQDDKIWNWIPGK